MDASDHEFKVESEVAQARLEGLIEDGREQHEFEVDGLTNIEVLTLATALNHGCQAYAAHESPQQAKFIHSLERELQQQNPDLFEELADIHEPFVERMMDGDDPSPSGVLGWFRSRFGATGSGTTGDRAWQLGGVMILVQASIAVFNLGALLVEVGWGVSIAGDWLVLALTASTAIVGAIAFAFALGYVHRMRATGTEQGA